MVVIVLVAHYCVEEMIFKCDKDVVVVVVVAVGHARSHRHQTVTPCSGASTQLPSTSGSSTPAATFGKNIRPSVSRVRRNKWETSVTRWWNGLRR